MSIHIHLYGCNCVFCTSEFPFDFFQSQTGDGPNTQMMSTKMSGDESEPLDDCPDMDEEYPDIDDEDEEEEDEEEDDDEDDAPRPNRPHEKKLFGFLIGKHNICIL